VNSASLARQRVLALFLPLTAALYMGAVALNPKGTDQVISTTATALKTLPIAAKHPTQLYVSSTLTVLALGAFAVSYAGFATLARRRGARLATVAALVGGIGAFAGVVVNVLVGFNLAAAATTHVTREAAAQFLVTTFNSVVGQTFLYGYLAAEYLAPILVAVALWRSRSVPKGLVTLFLIGMEVAEQVGSVGPVAGILLTAPFAVAMALLAGRIWQAPVEAVFRQS
jgi:hypothetical protein